MKKWLKRTALFLVYFLVFNIVTVPFSLAFGPFDRLREMVMESIVNSRRGYLLASRFLPAEVLEKYINERLQAAEQIAESESKPVNFVNKHDPTIELKEIKSSKFEGKLLIVHDPTRVKVVMTQTPGKQGERVSDMVKRVGAIAGINGGGFYDLNWEGNGGLPQGPVIHNGKIIYQGAVAADQVLIALDREGRLLLKSGNHTYTQEEIDRLGIMEGVSFGPVLVANGRGRIIGDGGWGTAPRTAIGQRADGAILMLVIDGRRLHSIGATLKDVQDIMLHYGAVTAVNLDGGSSTTMVYEGEVINVPANPLGERYVPTAFVVMP
ncbi:MAG: hypothetical protein PWQ91_878 [Eubacteriales bacterium]|nr:hypothetical protein [Eubacteriales bacterium]